MTQFPDDDQALVAFLKRYRPIVPPPSPTLEQQLMTQIAVNSSRSQRDLSLKAWGIGSAILASLLLAWGSYSWLRPPAQVTTKSDEWETFVVQSWQETFSEPMPTTSEAFLLNETEYHIPDYELRR